MSGARGVISPGTDSGGSLEAIGPLCCDCFH